MAISMYLQPLVYYLVPLLKFYRESAWLTDDEDALTLVKLGEEGFLLKVAMRILSEFPDKVLLNCPATRMKTTMFSGLMTTINLPDDINSGLSHYYSEVKRVKKVAELLVKNENMFVIFDELFRGTNVKDAYDASLSIISELANIHTSIFFISTHIMELAEELKKFNNISFRYMDVLFENKKPIFTYQLKNGVSTERLGMYIVENEGIIELIKKAQNTTFVVKG